MNRVLNTCILQYGHTLNFKLNIWVFSWIYVLYSIWMHKQTPDLCTHVWKFNINGKRCSQWLRAGTLALQEYIGAQMLKQWGAVTILQLRRSADRCVGITRCNVDVDRSRDIFANEAELWLIHLAPSHTPCYLLLLAACFPSSLSYAMFPCFVPSYVFYFYFLSSFTSSPFSSFYSCLNIEPPTITLSHSIVFVLYPPIILLNSLSVLSSCM